ncbi:MAG: endonuclease/exonuclease/phosphatase family protein [Candidatus Cryptobacteroides sp.]
MKKFLLYILTFLLLTNFAATAQNTGAKSHVIGFYNLENLFDIYDDPAKNDEQFLPDGQNNWTAEKYALKLKNMAQVIRAMKEDNGCWHTILGVSEIENRLVLEDLVNEPQIAEAGFEIVHYDGPDRRGVDVGLLYDPKKFNFIESQSIPFTFDGTQVDITLDKEAQENFRTRDILMVRGTIGGEMFAFYVAHLPSRLGGKGFDLRSRGGEIMYNHARALEQEYPGIKIVCMGDMNDDPQDDSMAKWLHGRETIGEMTPEDFFNPYLSMIKDGYGSLCYRGTWCIYDQELVNYNLATAPQGGYQIKPIVKKKYYGRIFHKPFMITQSGQYKGYPFRTFSNGTFAGGYSDHFPTYIVISR